MSQPPFLTCTVSRSPSPGRQYTEEEWERVKQPFYHYYMEKNLSLKKAAECVAEKHGFEATPRQWERRIAPEKWNFTKYANRDARLKAIEAAGKSLLDVSHRGRRKSTGSSEGEPDFLEDRNWRRWARRELSRGPSRPRAKSVSGLSETSDHAMSGTSTAAPSPAHSEYFMDTMEEPGPLLQPTVSSMSDIWGSPNPMSNVPVIRLFDVPDISVSAPDESSFIAPDHIPVAAQSQVNVHYPPVDEQFDAFQPRDSTFGTFDSGVDLASRTNMSWDSMDAFTTTTTAASTFPQFDFSSDPSLSFTQMMNMENPSMRPPKTTVNSQLDAFNNADLQLTEPIQTPITPADAEPSAEDPTHADVHALLQEHYTTTLQMLSMCIESCEHATGDNNIIKNVVMKHLRLLQTGIQASNVESDRKIKNTLKDVALTQRRATQSIKDLSSNRKRKIERLQADIGQLQAQVQSSTDTSFGYG
ncbi:hypothetical protein LTR70_006552 [Exophiala xenobiotica]|nr:hypothetical protein LTR70_006552 [Exophiala xenobiotica]